MCAGSKHALLGLVLNNLGFLLKDIGAHDRAMKYYEEALAVRTAYVNGDAAVVHAAKVAVTVDFGVAVCQ